MEKIQIKGSIYKDATEHVDADGNKYLIFTVEVPQKKDGKKESHNYYNVTKYIVDSRLKYYLLKGTHIFVEGEFSLDTFQGKLCRQIKCNVLEFISKISKESDSETESEETETED